MRRTALALIAAVTATAALSTPARVLASGQTVSGRVLGIGACASDPCSRRGMLSVRVVLTDGYGEQVSTKLTKLDGSFSFRVPPGRYAAKARAVPGYPSPDMKRVDVTAHQDGPQRVRLRLAATSAPGVIGQATKSPTCGGPQRQGEQCTAPMEGVQIHVEDGNGKTIATQTTGRNGYYAFELSPGTYDLVAESTGSSLPSAPDPVTFTVDPSDTGPRHIDSDYDTGIR